MKTSLTIDQLNAEFLKKNLEKLNSMLITTKKLEKHIDEAKRVLFSSPSLYKTN